ncbi:MAG: flagellar basal body rod protein FlgB [Lachnospiraceae bacterium]|nr:flagellar basal body rod protein FlgB [Lachnospiraceae bacterium]
MFCSNVYDYINVLGTAADATATRNEILANNIANVNTPNYKRKDIRFETELKYAFLNSDRKTVDATVKQLDLDYLQPEVYTDYAELSYRYDGNNVDIDNENAMLAANQIKYNGIIDSVNHEFSMMKMAMQ